MEDTAHISYDFKIPKPVILILHMIDIINYGISFFLHITGLHPSFRIFPSPWGESGSSSASLLIKSRLPVRKYGVGKQDEEQICAVCLNGFGEEDEVRDLGNCAHVFHTCCVDEWIDTGKMTCPVCRLKLLPLKEGSFCSLVGKLW